MRTAIFTKPPFNLRVHQPRCSNHRGANSDSKTAAGDTRMYQMDEVSDSSNTSSAPAAPVIGARHASSQLRRLSQQDGASGNALLDDSILTVASADAGHVLPVSLPVQPVNNADGTTALQAAAPGATEPRMAGDGMSSLGIS